jgi:triosephosphate isomerase
MAGKLWQDEAFKAVYPEADWDGAREFKVSEGYEPLIFDLDATDPGGNSQLSDLLGEGYTLLHISKDLAASEAQGQAEINALFADAKNRGWRTAALTPSTPEGAVAFAAEHGADYPFYTTDPTELKIIVRNNPGVVLIQDGVVLDKWAWRDIPRSCDAALGRD